MGSFYQRVTGRRQLVAGSNDDTINWLPVKDDVESHQRWGSEPRDALPAIAGGRSRSRTMNSAMSFYAASNSDSSNHSSRAASPHLIRDKPILAIERRENTAKTLLSKGSRILRKHGSKFSLSSLHTMDSDTSERYNVSRPVTAYTAKDRPSPVEVVKREELKRAISEPFDFQHVTHTDRVFLNSMERVPKTELVGEFSALRAGQASKPQLRGIRAEALPAQKSVDSAPTSPVTKSEVNIDSSLPQTPPRPTPPPKDGEGPLSPAHLMRISRSVDSFPRPSTSSSTSQVTPPRRYSSRRAPQPSSTSPLRSLGGYAHSPSDSLDAQEAGSAEDLCITCEGIDFVDGKPLPSLPPIHAITTNDDSARHLRVAPLPRTPLDLADVPEEDETKRQSVIEPQLRVQAVRSSAPIDDNTAINSNTARTSVAQVGMAIPLSNQTVVLDEWDDAIDDSWDYATEPDEIAIEWPSSMTAQVASFVDKAMTKLAAPEQSESSTSQQAKSTVAISPPPASPQFSSPSSKLRLSTRERSSPNGSESSPLLGLGIELQRSSQQGLESCTTPTPVVPSVASEVNDTGSSLMASFNSDSSVVSGISKCSSQESIIWSIASSIMGTQRSSNSSNSLVEQLPDYPSAVKSIDELKEALESVQEHLQEVHEDQSDQNYSSHQAYPPGNQSHQRAQSLATDFVYGTGSHDIQRRRSTSSSRNSPRASNGHERVPSGSRVPIPARKSSVRDQPELGRPPARRMRSATTTTRSRHASRASYSLFPGT